MKNDLMFLDNEERLTETNLEELVGGKRHLTVKIEVCWVEKTDSVSAK
jgi:hypothetical protein